MYHTVSDRLNSKSPDIVFLHGYCEGQWIWNELIDYIGTDFKSVVLDLPGFGNNQSLPSEVSIDSVAQMVWNQLDEKGITHPFLVGHSLGGYVLLAMAEARPEQIAGLALVHSTPFSDSPERKENRNKVIAFINQHGSKPFLDQFAPGLFRDPGSGEAVRFRKMIDQTPTESIVFYAAAMRDRPDRSEFIKQTDKPVLIVGGRFDPIIPPEICAQIGALGSGIDLFILEHSAHAGMLEEPAECAKIIGNFVKKLI